MKTYRQLSLDRAAMAARTLKYMGLVEIPSDLAGDDDSIIGIVVQRDRAGRDDFRHAFTKTGSMILQHFAAERSEYQEAFDSMAAFRAQELPMGSGQHPFETAEIRFYRPRGR